MVAALFLVALSLKGPVAHRMPKWTYPDSRNWREIKLNGVWMTQYASEAQPSEVETFYRTRLKMGSMRLGGTARGNFLGKPSSTGAVAIERTNGTYQALTQIRNGRYLGIFIFPAETNGTEVLMLEYKFHPKRTPPLGAGDVPKYPGVEGPFGASSSHYRGYTFSTPDSVDAVIAFYSTNIFSGGEAWRKISFSPEAASDQDQRILQTTSNRLFFLRAVRPPGDLQTHCLYVLCGN